MLFIDSNSDSIKEISSLHFKTIICVIRKRVGSNIKCSDDCPICNGNLNVRTGVTAKLRDILEDENNLRNLILSKPKELVKVNNSIFKKIFGATTFTDIQNIQTKKNSYKSDQKKDVSKRDNIPDISAPEALALKSFELLSKIIDYEEWFNKLPAHAEYGPYKLASKLDMRSCTYCNRQYTLTIKSETNDSSKLTRPQFDHWISKDTRPLLGLSFFNLIPSCSTCNSSVKGSVKLNTNDFVHPYIDDIIDSFKFRFEYWITIDQYKISVESNALDQDKKKKIEKTLKTFKIEEVYNGHHPELDDLVQLTKAYSPKYLQTLKNSFPGVKLSDEQIYRYAFGTELRQTEFNKRPLSKFKYDILKQLGIID